MEFFIQKQLLNIVYSVILGLILGVIYDIIRIIHILCGIASYSGDIRTAKSGKLPFFVFLITDFVYVLAVTALYSIFAYWADNGRFRVYLLLAAAAGFYLYYNTVGRMVMFFSEALVSFLKKMFYVVFIKPVKFILKVMYMMLKFIYSVTLKKIIICIKYQDMKYKTRRYGKKLEQDIIFKETEK